MVQLVQTELWPPTLREARSWRPLAVTYSPPTRCPRCRGRVVQTWAGEIPKCLDCGWEDYSRPLRSVSVGIQIPPADDFETERLMFNEPESAA